MPSPKTHASHRHASSVALPPSNQVGGLGGLERTVQGFDEKVNGPPRLNGSVGVEPAPEATGDSDGWDFDEEADEIGGGTGEPSASNREAEQATANPTADPETSRGWDFDEDDGLDAIDSGDDGWDFDE